MSSQEFSLVIARSLRLPRLLTLNGLLACAALVVIEPSVVLAETKFFDDFQAYPVSNPADFSATGNWTHNGVGSSGNENRIFQTGNFGGTLLWIAGPSDAGSGISSIGIPAESSTSYSFSAALVGETGDGTRTANMTVDVLLGASFATATSIIGGPQNFEARGDFAASVPDSIDNTYADQISSFDFTTAAVPSGHQLFLSIEYAGSTHANPPFVGVDNVRLFANNGFQDTPQVIVNRDTGNVKLVNATSSDLDLLGYSLLSNFGGLDDSGWTPITGNLDAVGNGQIDANDNWSKVAVAGGIDLSEVELTGGDGGVLSGGGPTGETFDLGNVWTPTYNEDLTFEVLRTNGTIEQIEVLYEGNNGNAFDFGDLNADGELTLLDWQAFKLGYNASLAGLSGAQAYLSSDLNGDSLHSLEDMSLFRAAYDDANGAGAFQAMIAQVPEPATLMLLAPLGITFLMRRRMRYVVASFCLLATFGVGTSAWAVPLDQLNSSSFTYKYEMNAAPSTQDLDANGTNDWRADVGAAFAEPALSGGLAIGAAGTDSTGAPSPLFRNDAAGMLNTATVNGSMTVEFSVKLIAGTQEADDAGTFGVVLSQPGDTQSFRLNIDEAEVNFNFGGVNPISTPSNTDGQHVFRIAFDNQNGINGSDDHYWVWRDDVLLNPDPNTPFVGSNGNAGDLWYLGDFSGSLSGSWEVDYIRAHSGAFSPVGTLTSGPLTLEVDTASGEAVLKNTFQTPLDVVGYSITSASGSLNPAAWASLQENPTYGNGIADDGVGFEQVGTTVGHLAEAILTGSETFSFNESVSLGEIFASSASTDYNGNGIVDSADYTVWRDNLGLMTGATQSDGDGDGDQDVDQADYALWKSTFGNVASGGGTRDLAFRFELVGGSFVDGIVTYVDSASASTVAAVPEPTSLGLLFGSFCVLALFARKRTSAVWSLALATTLLVNATGHAAITYDRLYKSGDSGSGDKTLAPPDVDSAATVNEGSPVGFLFGGLALTADDVGPSGGFIDATVNGAPTYASVSTRPGASASDFGVRFDGVDDSLRNTISLNAPTQMWDSTTFFPSTPFPLNYEGIFSHGIAAWAKPDVPALSDSNVGRQDVVIDTQDHGIFITDSGNWGLLYDKTSIDTGVSVTSTLDANGWVHVMELAGFDSPIGGDSAFGGALYVNGVAVAAQNTFYDPSTLAFSVGSDPDGSANFYKGVIDNPGLFFWGDNTGQDSGDGRLGKNWGALDLGTDNEWIAHQLATLGVTNRADVNLDSVVNSQDATALLANWRYTRRVNGIQIGDWQSRQQGDLNYDGVVNLSDAFVLHQSLMAATGTGFDFSLIPGASVPEPASICLVGMVLAVVASMRTRRC